AWGDQDQTWSPAALSAGRLWRPCKACRQARPRSNPTPAPESTFPGGENLCRLSDGMQIVRRQLAGPLISNNVEGDHLSFIEALHPRPFDCPEVHEDIFTAVIRLDESVAFLAVEPLHGSLRHTFLFVAVATRPRTSPAERLFTSKFALARNSLMRFRYVLDPVLKLAVTLGQLPGHHIAATDCASMREACNERNFLTGSKLVLCHHMAFRAHARGHDTARRSHQQLRDTEM